MFDKTDQSIIIFVLTSLLLIFALIGFVALIIYKYQQKQNTHLKDIEALKTSHENTLLQSQLEIQEQTFQNISREIHDNIGQKLTLAKLHLNTLTFDEKEKTVFQVNNSVNMISDAINDLTDISRSMSSELILNNGLIKALEFEAEQLKKSGIYVITLSITGNTVFLNTDTELLLFRIVQEATNNIIKHAEATAIDIHLHYDAVTLLMKIKDNGKGFNPAVNQAGTGLQNIKKRTMMLMGKYEIETSPNKGTTITIEIPLNNKDATL